MTGKNIFKKTFKIVVKIRIKRGGQPHQLSTILV